VKRNSKRSVIIKNGVPIATLELSKRAKKWKMDRRFSSASSQETDDDTSKTDHKKIFVATAEPSSISNLRKSLNRQISDGSCLDELRESLEKDGDLAKTVVRIEVSRLLVQLTMDFF
jgi:hypothetical protein